jgi:predicted ATPase/transcriptional regulator with XRE-family HTH domain
VAAGLSQEELAERAGLSRRGISDLERGMRRVPYPATVRRLAQALGLDEAERTTLHVAARSGGDVAKDGGGAPDAPNQGPSELDEVRVNLQQKLGSGGSTAPSAAPATFESPHADAVPPHHNLPAQLSSFVGREQEVAAVRRLLAAHRLVTLTGPGGTGKTRLALAVAHLVPDAFADGVFFVTLAAVGDPGLVMPTIGQTLGLREVGERSMLEILRGFLYDKCVLLVLDNLEHLLGAVSAVAELLGACPRLRVLATSRSVLRVSGEQELAIPPLGLPSADAADDPDRLLRSEAIQLFVERTRAVRAEFELSPANGRCVAEICARVDGLPLAIELAAARMRLLPPSALLRHLDDALAVLTTAPRDAPRRQQTLRRAIAWSYDLLEPDEQALFRRLGVFVGGVTFEAVTQVANAASPLRLDLLDGVDSLLRNSLLTVVEPYQGEPRFGMLETIRAFALEQLDLAGETRVTRNAHAQAIVHLAETATPELLTGMALAWFWRLEDELDNIRAAMDWLRSTDQFALALRLVQGANWFFAFGGHQLEARRWHDDLLARKVGTPEQRFVSLFQVAQIAVMVGDYARVTAATEEVDALGPLLGDELARVYSLYVRIEMAVRRRERQLDTAERDGSTLIAALEHAIRTRSMGAVGEPLAWHLALAYGGWGLAALGNGKLVEAAERSSKAIEWARSAGGRALVGITHYWAAQVAMTQRQWRTAGAYLTEADEALSAIGNKETLADVHSKQAILALVQGDVTGAETRFRDALRLFQAVGEKAGALEALLGLAATAIERGDPLGAATLVGAVDSAQQVIDSAPSLFDPLLRGRVMAALEEAAELDVESALAAGRRMSFEQAEAAALRVG